MPQNIASSYMVSKDYELLDSIKELDSLLNNDPSFKFPDGETLKERIRKGKNFVPYQFKGDDELRFLPSRTVGFDSQCGVPKTSSIIETAARQPRRLIPY